MLYIVLKYETFSELGIRRKHARHPRYQAYLIKQSSWKIQVNIVLELAINLI